MTHNSTALTDLAGTGAAPGAPYLDFGARLYSPGTATWLSVDPMAEKYYGIGPLTYCAGNPVNLMDPTGRKLVVRDSSEGLATEYEWQEVGETWGFYDVDGKAFDRWSSDVINLMFKESILDSPRTSTTWLRNTRTVLHFREL